MKLTRASCYALHAVAYMAQRKTKGAVASHKIAEARGISDRFLLKVLKPLVGARVLKSVKGPHGGYELARPASEISVLEIIEVSDNPIRGNAPHTEKPNALNGKLESICNTCAEAVRKHLQKVRVSDLIAGAKSDDDEPVRPSRRKARETAS